jgi:3-methyladenine DNA glycosylase AlkD
MSECEKIVLELKSFADPVRAVSNSRFFKSNPGEYGEGDIFLGVTVPEVREVSGRYITVPLTALAFLFDDSLHEVRLCAAIILTLKYQAAATLLEKRLLFEFYLEQIGLGRVNNWDIVDCSAPVLGNYLTLVDNALDILTQLATSNSLWERRVAIVATFALMREGQLLPTYNVALLLLKDNADLMHKATGWMLREMGKRDLSLLRKFLKENSKNMPRTMLRYSIEKLSVEERRNWLKISKI